MQMVGHGKFRNVLSSILVVPPAPQVSFPRCGDISLFFSPRPCPSLSMVTTKLSRTESSPASRPGAVSHARPSRLDLHPLKSTSEHAARHGSGYTTPTAPVSQDSSSFIDGRPKTAAEKRREKRLLDDPLADLLGPLFVGCKRCGTRIKLSPKSSYDPFHWVKHRERCLRRSIEAIKEILRERGEQAGSLGAKSAQQDHDAAVVDAHLATPSRVLSPSPSPSLSPSSPLLQRPNDTDSTTPPLTADENEVDKSSHSHQPGSPPGEDGEMSRGPDGPPANTGTGEATQPLCALSVFRASDMLSFEDYLHRSRRLPTHLGFPELLPSPDKWHDWSWGQLRAPVYVVGKRPKGMQAAAGADPPFSSDGDVGNSILRPEARKPSDSSGDAFMTAHPVNQGPVVERRV
ncbi:hypothetical protein BJV78DRAFT_579489 [Lactifluus subvellereus]|nr:hypothetical protein BJV78DRAFT_579489 [Lactifluus subvellereus]